MWSFIPSFQLGSVIITRESAVESLSHPVSKCTPRRSRPAITATTSQNTWPSQSSTALNYDKSFQDNVIRYLDLRTMKVISPDDAHLTPSSPPGVGFAAFNEQKIPTDGRDPESLRQLLFTSDTVPLSEAQKDVVSALLSHRSVLYTAVSADDKYAIFLDLVMRSRLWKDCVVYCASSRRAAETVFTTLCAQLGPERRNEVVLDLGDGAPQQLDGSLYPDDNARVVITSPQVLGSAAVNCESGSWFEKASIVFIDDINELSLRVWEEVLISLPNRILICLISSHLSRPHFELLPIWLETIQNTVSVVSPFGASSVLNRIERPQNLPLLRTFAYNAANHQYPVQVSLAILRDLMQKEIDSRDGKVIPNYAEAFLHGISMIPAENPVDLEFSSAAEATYADVAALIVADAKRTESSSRAKTRKRSRTRRKERTASSKAAARRRREAAYADSFLLPAIVLVKGATRSLSAATAVLSALANEVELLWDDDSKDDVESVVDSFREKWNGQLTGADLKVLAVLRSGIAVVHDMYTSSVRLLAEELFRGGLIPVLVADTYLGSEELRTFSSAKSVLAESTALATCDDSSKGLILASTAASLAGRLGKDDVGNLIVMWYDESVDDESAGHEIATTLLNPVLTNGLEEARPGEVRPYATTSSGFSQSFETPQNLETRRLLQSEIASSYEAVLRSVRRYGVDGYQSIFEYTLSSFKGWLERGALHATLEKVSVENAAINERLEAEDWGTIAEHERKGAKVSEARRVVNAMTSRLESVLERRILEELKRSKPGRIIGVKGLAGKDEDTSKEQKVLRGVNLNEELDPKPVDKVNDDVKMASIESDRSDGSHGSLQLAREGLPKKGQLSAAVFVVIFDQEADGKRVAGISSRYIVVCILADGTWTMVPISDVEAMTSDDEALIANVDLLVMPHHATFDFDPVSEWAKCVPIDETERLAVHRISDELIARVTSEKRPQLLNQQVPEFEAQRGLMRKLEETYKSSVWYGRDNELMELRRLRRRGAKVGDEMKSLQRRKDQFEGKLFKKHNDYRSVQTSLMAVLEDCHALLFQGDGAMEMTPIGALASILPCEFPLFTSACMCLIDDIEQLSVQQFAAFVGIVVCTDRLWSRSYTPEEEAADNRGDNDEEPLDMSNVRKSWKMNSDEVNNPDNASNDEFDPSDPDDRRKLVLEVESLKDHLPMDISEMVVEIRHALYQLHGRHLDDCQAMERMWVCDIVPTSLNIRIAQAASRLANGAPWHEVSGILEHEGGYAVREMRRINSVLDFIRRDTRYSEFSARVKELAGETYKAMNRWPVRDHDTMLELLEFGVIERPWSGNAYDKWWRSVREPLKELGGDSEEPNSTSIESVEAEIIESS